MATPGWNPADFQTDVFDFWKWGVTMLSLGVTMFNFMVVCAALRNRRIRADLFLYAANALLLSQCILHTIYPLTVSVSRILVIKTGGWSEPLCSSNAVMGNFSITAAALLGLSMSIERLLAVVFLKRMKPKFALACILATIVLSLLNVQAHFFFAESHTLIGRSGLGCYPSSVCTFQGLADASIYLVNAIFMAFTYAAILRQLSRNFSQRRKDTALIQTAVPSPVPLGKSKSGISMQSVSFKFARMVPRKMSREDRIQIIFAIRGVVGVAVFTTYAAAIGTWLMMAYLTRARPPAALEVAQIVIFYVAEIADAFIFVCTDIRLRAALTETYFWWARRKHVKQDHLAATSTSATENQSAIVQTIHPHSSMVVDEV